MVLDVSPHLVFKNGMTPTLWPQDMPFPPDEGKEEVASTFGDTDASQQPGDRSCFTPNTMQYPTYFKDAKGMNHSMFGASTGLGALQYFKQGSVTGGKGCLPDVIQHGRSAGMFLTPINLINKKIQFYRKLI